MNNAVSVFQSFAPKNEKLLRKQRNGCLIYTRVSSKEQMEGASLETQMNFCHLLAQKKGYNIIEHFGGTYESAQSDERKEFKNMISFAQRNKHVGYILIYSYDRFSRTGANGIYITEELKKQGIHVLSATQEIDVESSSGTFQQGIHFVFSRYDNDQRRDRSVNGMITKLRNGYITGSIPFGYSNLNPGKKKLPNLQINADGELIREAFLLKANHDLSYNDITERLQKKGWTKGAKRLSEIFRNPFYCGIIVSSLVPDEVIKTDKHPAIVSEDVFLKVNGILSEKRTTGYKYNRDEENLPLKQFVKAESDGTPYTGYLVKKKGLYYYKNNTKGSKENKSAKAMHELFKQLLSEYVLYDYNAVEPIKALMIEMCTELQKESIDNATALESELYKLEKDLALIERRFVLGEITLELYTKYSQEFQKDVIRIKEELESSTFKLSNLEKAIDKVLKYALQLPILWESGDLEEKRRIQNMVFPCGIVYDFKNGHYRTDRVNSLFSFIPIFTRVSAEKKKGTIDNFRLLSPSVPRAGIEPAHPKVQDFESSASTSSATEAFM